MGENLITETLLTDLIEMRKQYNNLGKELEEMSDNIKNYMLAEKKTRLQVGKRTCELTPLTELNETFLNDVALPNYPELVTKKCEHKNFDNLVKNFTPEEERLYLNTKSLRLTVK